MCFHSLTSVKINSFPPSQSEQRGEPAAERHLTGGDRAAAQLEPRFRLSQRFYFRTGTWKVPLRPGCRSLIADVTNNRGVFRLLSDVTAAPLLWIHFTELYITFSFYDFLSSKTQKNGSLQQLSLNYHFVSAQTVFEDGVGGPGHHPQHSTKAS